MVTDIYKADIASYDGDRTDYLNKANNAQKVIGNFGKVMGTVNELSNKYLDMNPAEQKKMVLRSQFLGKDGDKRKAYIEFLNDPSKMNIRIQGSDIIITNDGQDLFNGTQLLNSVKDGNSLIEYANDYTEQINLASKDALKGVGNLETIRQYQKLTEQGTKLTDVQDNDRRKSMKAYENNLRKSDKIDALLNESTFQRYIDSDEVYNSEKHDKITKDKIIEQLVNKQFPGGGYVTEKVTQKIVTPKKVEDKEEQEKSFNNWIKDNLRKKKKIEVTTSQGGYEGQGIKRTSKTKEVDIPLQEQKQIFYEKLVTENPKYVFGSQIDMTGENANKVYQRIGNTIRPFSITDKQIQNDEYLNKVLVSESVL